MTIPTRHRPAPRRLPAVLAAAAFGVFLLLWTLLPLFTIVSTAITPRADLFDSGLWPSAPTLENFTLILRGGPDSPLPEFWTQLGNSLATALGTTALVLTIALLASYAIARLRPRWGGPISAGALALYVVPAAFLAIPLYLLMGNLGLLETIPGLILALTTISLPYSVWMLRQFGAAFPAEIEEAATMDGAGPGRIFVSLYVPLIRAPLVPVGMYVFLLAWNDFLYAFLFLTDPARLTVPIGMSSLLTEQAPWTAVMATGVLYSLVPITLFAIFRRHLVSGATAGSATG